jgi:type IV pilus assembly protein PilC
MEQLAILIGANVNITKALDIIAKDQRNSMLALVCESCRNAIIHGKSCHEALQELPEYFNKLICSLVRVGEEAGILDTMLTELANYLKRNARQKNQLLKALIYPSVILIIGIIVCAIFFLLIIPQFENMFTNFGSQLPAYTQLIIGISHGVKKLGLAILIVVTGLFLGIKKFYGHSLGFRLAIDRLALRTPILKNIIQYAAMARLMKTLGLMLGAGIMPLKAMEIAKTTVSNRCYELALDKLMLALIHGKSISEALDDRLLFPYQVVQLIALGEETGSLDTQMSSIATIYEEKLASALENFHTLFGPMVMLVLGIIVGGLVIGIYLPIFRLGMVV